MTSRRRQLLLTTAFVVGTTFATTPVWAADASGAPTAADTSTQVPEVVVTARRRDENLQTTPVAVTALTASDIQARSIVNIADIAASTPNLAISPAIATKNTAKITIRGQVQNDALITLDPSVGVYVNDVYFARAYSVLNDLLDVQQVEVLKGPQGTLYGRNTTGGAIKITTQRPDLSGDPTGFITVGAGNFSSRDISGAFGMPLIDGVLAIRYAAANHRHDGYTTSYLVTEPALTRVRAIDTDNLNSYSQRLSIRFQPTDRWSFDLVGSTYRADDNGSLAVNVAGDIENMTSPPPAFAFGFTTSPERQRDFYSALTPVAPFSYARNSTATLTSRFDISDDVFTKLILGYVDAKNHSRTNAAGVVTGSVALVEFSPDLTQRQRQFSAEWQIGGASLDSRLNWIGGLYYFKEDGIESSPATTRVFGSVSAVAFVGTAENSSQSAYANVTYEWTDRLTTSAGLRYTSDEKSLLGENRRQTGICVYTAGPGITTSVVPGGPCLLDRSDTFNYTTWEIEGDFKFTSDIFGYAKAGNGFRSGGQQLRAVNAASAEPFTPEEVVNYEVGLKSELFDRRVRLNLAVFHTEYSDIQLSLVRSPPAYPTTTTQVVNQGNATVDGAEVEATIRLTDNFTLSGAYGYTDFQFDDPTLQQTYTPKRKWALTAAYTQPLPFGDLVGRVDYSSQSSFFVSPAKAAFSEMPSRSLLDARLSLMMTSGLELSVYGKNLGEEEYFTAGVQSANVLGVMLGAPRTYGVDLTYRF